VHAAPRRSPTLRRRTALDQGKVKLLLEFPHGLGHRRLTDVERHRGAGKAAPLGNGKKDPQVMQIHPHNLFS